MGFLFIPLFSKTMTYKMWQLKFAAGAIYGASMIMIAAGFVP